MVRRPQWGMWHLIGGPAVGGTAVLATRERSYLNGGGKMDWRAALVVEWVNLDDFGWKEVKSVPSASPWWVIVISWCFVVLWYFDCGRTPTEGKNGENGAFSEPCRGSQKGRFSGDLNCSGDDAEVTRHQIL